MMSSMSSEQYEVIYTLRSEMFNKQENSIGPGPFGGPCGFGRSWMMMDLTPAERDVFLKYRQKGKRTVAVGVLLGASVMAGIWKLAALRRGMGVTGMIVGGVIGAGVLMRTSGIQREMATEMLQLPEEKSQRAAESREMSKHGSCIRDFEQGERKKLVG
ncbi:hypothetical protein V7S43_012694 [Phytophthora oleae]|uniref:Transmembrane protein n=1 Tax=Phytophthora oleae TaxID=2107226 RepID=A0ABD3F7D9_9STRA